MLLYKDGMIDLLHSTFQSNFAITNSTDGIGIVNMGGEVRCDTLGCLPVCTACLSPPPTLQPTVTKASTVTSAAPTVAAADSTQLSSLVLWLAGFGFVLVGVVSAWCLRVHYCRSHSGGDDAHTQLPFRRLDDAGNTELLESSIELAFHNVMESHEFSPGMYIRFCVMYVLASTLVV